MYKTVIVEDEFNAREALRKMLSLLFKNIEVVAEFAAFADAEKYLNEHSVDIVFFDIELEDGASVDKLKNYDTSSFQVIFVTSYSQYAIEAIKLSAIDYIMKPVDPEELKTAVDKAIEKIKTEVEHLALKEIEKQHEETQKRIVIKTTDNTYYLEPENIIYLEAEGAYTTIVTSDRKILTSRNLKHYEELLETHSFARTHQKYLVNIKHVIKIEGQTDILLSNHDIVKISTRKRSEFMKRLNG